MIRKGSVGKLFRVISGFNRGLDLLLLWPALPWVSEIREREDCSLLSLLFCYCHKPPREERKLTSPYRSIFKGSQGRSSIQELKGIN